MTQSWQNTKAPRSIGYRIKLLSQLLTRQFQDKIEPYGLTPFHWVVLCCLWEQDGLATSDIGDRLCQVGGTLTGVIDRMEERGLVRRERDQRDRRVWRIWLTDDGRKLEEILPPLAIEINEKTLHGLSEAERQNLSQWVDVMIANLS
ncbi:MarR family winged helix-turn-helix transcriptional regulator [Egbenema bharatensis]|uniref:MarR family winged helix-turn-helix transcriptional regulator n=1 Tax=Egbenema bharatensis TaxID=3463334 RepID=UPI003A87B9D1